MVNRKQIGQAYRNATAAKRAVTRALRRPKTYRSAVKEALWLGANMAMYPAGVLSEALEPEVTTGFDGRFTPQLPLRYLDPEAASTPIVLLHGYFHNRSGFLVIRRSLRRAGFRHISTLNYNVIGHNVEELARGLAVHVDRVLAETGAHRVHLIGHSLGGLVARAYVQLAGGEDKVHTCITLGTPHSGTYSAFVGRGKAARELRPGSELLARLNNGPASNVRFVSYYSNLDGLVIPASSAKITSPNLRATNILIKDLGHLSFLISQPLISSMIESLWRLEDRPAATVTALAKRRHKVEPA